MGKIALACRVLAFLPAFVVSGFPALGGHFALAQEFDIILPSNGVQLGGIGFPGSSGSSAAGVTLEFQAAGTTFTEAHIKSISWTLDPSGGVASLSLSTLIGDDPCDVAHSPCSNKTLDLNENSFKANQRDCVPDPHGGITCINASTFPNPVEFVPLAPAYTCEGFEAPLDGGPVAVRKNRALPFKAELLDENGFALTDQDVAAAPVLQVTYNSGIGAPPEDVTDETLIAGLGTNGNAFVFQGSRWRFNLKVRNFTAPGTYTATMVSGDGGEYGLAQTCTAQFVVQ